ncbi:hypothetical protein [Sabulicella rubraurantiaca]|uniref:hypothetical protein n=1 Tax=Sabulicella rubraurantiaca TaxID=2811429 RepID=UPI001A95DB4B|nr:hypothetical protein [Sabulicella rubraurantiaca]
MAVAVRLEATWTALGHPPGVRLAPACLAGAAAGFAARDALGLRGFESSVLRAMRPP